MANLSLFPVELLEQILDLIAESLPATLDRGDTARFLGYRLLSHHWDTIIQYLIAKYALNYAFPWRCHQLFRLGLLYALRDEKTSDENNLFNLMRKACEHVLARTRLSGDDAALLAERYRRAVVQLATRQLLSMESTQERVNCLLRTTRYVGEYIDGRWYGVRSAVHSIAIVAAAHEGDASLLETLLAEEPYSTRYPVCSLGDPLIVAVNGGHLTTVQTLCTNHYDKLAVDKTVGDDGLNALHLAARKGFLPIVDYLVFHVGADVNRTARRCATTALLLAAEAGHIPVVEYLFNYPATNRTYRRKDGGNALYEATRTGHSHVVRFLLQRGYLITDGRSPIARATADGRLDIVKLLLERGKRNSEATLREICRICLRTACDMGYMDLFEYFLGVQEESPFAQDRPGWAPFIVAAISGETGIFQRTVMDDKQEVLTLVVATTYFEDTLLGEGDLNWMDVRWRDSDGNSALRSVKRFPRTVQLLLSNTVMQEPEVFHRVEEYEEVSMRDQAGGTAGRERTSLIQDLCSLKLTP